MKILLAVSGGIDSMYMASRAPELFPGASFAIAHCNFSLRGGESDGDEKFVRKWATEHSIPIFVRRFDTGGEAAKTGESIEMAARRLRYAWFAELCRSEGFGAVAVAHNANDSAETLILNLLRGTGIRGLRGISADSEMMHTHILRPLLSTERGEIRQWMLEHGCAWREDSTNASNSYKRNMVRNEVFPVFEKINPSFLRTLQGDMERFSQVDDIAEEYYRGCSLEPGSIDLAALKAKKHWRYLLFRLTEGRLNASELESLSESLESGAQTAGRKFGPYVCSAGRLVLHEIREGDCCMVVHGPGTYDFNGRTIRFRSLSREELGSPVRPRGTLVADASRLKFPCVLRKWRKGDSMQPFGMKGRKKLSDLFVDLKWGEVEKDAAVVLVCPPDAQEGRVAALLGEKIDDSLKVGEQTREVVEISII